MYFIKDYKLLTKEELYQISKVRQDVFIVEQKCPYHDLDNEDQEAIHIFEKEEQASDKIKSYLRLIFKKPKIYITRVLVAKDQRKKHAATNLIEFTLDFIKKNFENCEIHLAAQVYAANLYRRLNFKEYGQDFLEDGIPHINMKYKV